MNRNTMKYLMASLAMMMLSQTAIPTQASADVVVIVHPSNKAALDKGTIKHIFMGRVNTFPDGGKATPLELAEGEVRKEFIHEFLQKTPGALDSYWSRMIFTGRAKPPKSISSQEEIRKMVAANPAMIGFVERSQVDSSVRVVELR